MKYSETQMAIRDTFMKLYARKEYNKINVKELCINTPIARSTFYSYYENLTEIKNEIEEELVVGILEIAKEVSQGDTENFDLSAFFEKTLDYIKENWNYIYTFLVAQPNYEFMTKWKAGIKYHFKLRFPDKVAMPNYDMIAEVLASAVLGGYVYWMEHPDMVDSKKLTKIITATFQAIGGILEPA